MDARGVASGWGRLLLLQHTTDGETVDLIVVARRVDAGITTAQVQDVGVGTTARCRRPPVAVAALIVETIVVAAAENT